MILTGYIAGYVYLFAVIFLIGGLQKLFRFEVEISRKLIHFLIGFVWLILYRYHRGTYHFVVVPFSFVIINYLSYRFRIFKMFEREETGKNHFGTIYYAVSITLMALISLIWEETLLPYGLAVFCLSFGDGAAALVGGGIKKYNPKITKEKSLMGTLGAMVFSFVGSILFLWIFPEMGLTPVQVGVIAFAAGLLELVGNGLDNFSLPLGVMALATFFSYGV